MKTILFLAPCLFSFLTGTSQIDNFVKNDIQNKEWLDVLKKQSLDSQLHAIRERVAFDTTINLSVQPRPPGLLYRLSDLDSTQREKATLRYRNYDSANLTAFPLWIATIGTRGALANFSKQISPKKFSAALSLINTKYISDVTLLTGETASALYCSEGNGGVVFLHVRSKKILRKFKRLTKAT